MDNKALKKSLFSIEVFPPKVQTDIDAIYQNMAEFKKLEPDFISVTYGAGGSQVGTSLEIATHIKNMGISPVAHLTCAGNTKEEVDNSLNLFEQNGIMNILALRGDITDERQVKDFEHATDLISHINSKEKFEISAACYPEGHPETGDFNLDMRVMKMKYDLGVRHFISQLFFDNDDFYKMCEEADKLGLSGARIEAGIMPVTNAKQILRMVGFSGAKLPSKLTKIISRYENNPVALKQAGINYAIEQITDLLTTGVGGIHLYAMNNPVTATTIHSAILPILNEVNG